MVSLTINRLALLSTKSETWCRQQEERPCKAVDSLQVVTNFEIGRMILEHEQQGVRRAEYGKMVLKVLSERLTSELGRGFSEDNLSNMRRFYLVYKDTLIEISEKPSRKSEGVEKISIKLSWSHYVFCAGSMTRMNGVSMRLRHRRITGLYLS